MKIIFEKNYISSIVTDINKNEVLNRTVRFHNLMNKLTKEFVLEQYYNGDKLIEFAKAKGLEIDDDYLLVKHESGVAMVDVFKGCGDLSVRPSVSVITNNFLRGWTFGTGSFSDIYVNISGCGVENLWFYTRDILLSHNLYLVWVLEKFEEQFLEDVDKEGDTLEHSYDDTYYRDIRENIKNEILKSCEINKSKRIDQLVVDGESVDEYIKKNIKYPLFCSDNDIFKICMKYGKQYSQVKKYLRKYVV